MRRNAVIEGGKHYFMQQGYVTIILRRVIWLRVQRRAPIGVLEVLFILFLLPVARVEGGEESHHTAVYCDYVWL